MLLLVKLSAFAQQYPDISQFMFNKLYYNPAAAGANESFQANLLYKAQWIGIQGAPSIQLFSADGRIKNTGIGLGGLVFNTHAAITNQTQASVNASYKIQIKENSFFSFGMRLGVMHYQSNLSSVIVWDPGDPNFTGNNINSYLPKIGAGLYYQSPKWYAGVSTPDLLTYDPNKVFTNRETNTSTLKKNYILQAGYKMTLSPHVYFLPNLLMIYYPSSPLLMKLNSNFTIDERITLGATYGINNTYGALIQVALNTRLKLSYNFEVTTNLNKVPYTNHEIMLYYGLQSK